MVFAVMAAVGALYYVLSTLALARHFRRPTTENRKPLPKVSVLKPVCGLDPQLRRNLLTYLDQNYPDYQVLFGALDADDPAAPLLQGLAGDCAHCSAHFGSAIAGANRKVRILHSLAARATGEILVITDADTRATPDFLARVVACFSDPAVGAATCFYRGVNARSTADALEALHMTCAFAPGVASAQALGGLSFGLGAAIAIRAQVLREIGGFEAIVDYLADDFQLGRRVAQAGHVVALTDYVIEIALGGDDLAEVLTREMRWSRTIRVSNPRGHLGMAATFGFAYAVFFWAAAGFSAMGWLALAAAAALRGATAWYSARVCLGDAEFLRRAHLLPLRDVLSLGVWVAGYVSRRVAWKGQAFRVSPDGTIKPI